MWQNERDDEATDGTTTWPSLMYPNYTRPRPSSENVNFTATSVNVTTPHYPPSYSTFDRSSFEYASIPYREISTSSDTEFDRSSFEGAESASPTVNTNTRTNIVKKESKAKKTRRWSKMQVDCLVAFWKEHQEGLSSVHQRDYWRDIGGKVSDADPDCCVRSGDDCKKKIVKVNFSAIAINLKYAGMVCFCKTS